MAVVIGDLLPTATSGERRVLDLLKRLPDSYFVWPELPINRTHLHYPDFVLLHHHYGIMVLEVKDWVDIVRADYATFTVRTRAGQERSEKNPFNEARHITIAIKEKLEEEACLLNRDGPHRGKLMMPCSFAVVFSNLTRMLVYHLGELVPPQYFIAQDDLEPGRLEDRLVGLNRPFLSSLTPMQVDAARRMLYPDVRVTAPRGTAADQAAVLDTAQEQAAKEALYEVPGAIDRTARNLAVRMVRGVAGSGKTTVLCKRAEYLAQVHPDWRIAVLTYNGALAEDLRHRMGEVAGSVHVSTFHALCRKWLIDTGDWQEPIGGDDQENRIAGILKNSDPSAARFDAEFLCAEFKWMKDSYVLDWQTYSKAARVGRGKPLSQSEREIVFEIFSRY